MNSAIHCGSARLDRLRCSGGLVPFAAWLYPPEGHSRQDTPGRTLPKDTPEGHRDGAGRCGTVNRRPSPGRGRRWLARAGTGLSLGRANLAAIHRPVPTVAQAARFPAPGAPADLAGAGGAGLLGPGDHAAGVGSAPAARRRQGARRSAKRGVFWSLAVKKA